MQNMVRVAPISETEAVRLTGWAKKASLLIVATTLSIAKRLL